MILINVSLNSKESFAEATVSNEANETWTQYQLDQIRDKLPTLMNNAADIQRYIDSGYKVQFKLVHNNINDDCDNNNVDDNNINDDDDDYFTAYDDLAVHRLMLADEPRNMAYLHAIEQHRDAIMGKVVLDVGSGTGILAMMCARIGGAKKVYAVEASNMASYTADIVEDNGLDNVVTVIQEAMEDVVLPEKVDVIISEWMGFALLHEGMLPSVLLARDRWLKPGGLMLPSHASIWAAPASMKNYKKEHVEFWQNVCGFDMSVLSQRRLAETQGTFVIRSIAPEELISPAQQLTVLDLSTIIAEELKSIDLPFSFTVGGGDSNEFAAICCWFDVKFRHQKEEQEGSKNEIETILCTGPHSAPTHWMQTCIMLGNFFGTKEGDDIAGSLVLAETSNPRHYSFSIEL